MTQRRIVVPEHVIDERKVKIRAMSLGLASAIFQADPERDPEYSAEKHLSQ